jgi:hypothetical protein
LCVQVNEGRELAHEVARWQAVEGSVLITTYTVFKENVLQVSEAGLPSLPLPLLQQQQQEEEDEEQPEDSSSMRGDAASKEAIRHALLHGVSIVVADKAHELRNKNTKVHKQPHAQP